MATTQPINQRFKNQDLIITRVLTVAAGNFPQEGTLVGIDSSGQAIEADTAHRVAGVAKRSVNAGWDITVFYNHLVSFSLPGIALSDLGKTAYVSDNNTLTLTPNTAIVGPVVAVDTTNSKALVHATLYQINNLVDSVFGRTGAVVAVASDYNASQVDNDSAKVSGTYVSDALDTLHDSETVLTKSTNYIAVAGDNAIEVETSGGNVTITMPDASSNVGVRIRVSKSTSDSNLVIIDTTGADTIGFQSQWTLSAQGDSITAISDGVSEWLLFTERHASATIFYKVDYDSNLGTHRVQTVAGTGNFNFEFIVPNDFLSIISLVIIANPASGAAGPGKDIDLISNYGAVGELYNNHAESDTTTVYDFTGQADRFVEIDISQVFSSLSAGDICGINIDHNGVGGSIRYVGISLEYLKKG